MSRYEWARAWRGLARTYRTRAINCKKSWTIMREAYSLMKQALNERCDRVYRLEKGIALYQDCLREADKSEELCRWEREEGKRNAT